MKKQIACLAVVAILAVLSIGNYELLNKAPQQLDNPYVTLVK